MKNWLNLKFYCLSLLGWLILSSSVVAQPLANATYLNRAKLVSQQIVLLKNRLSQSKNELEKLQHYQDAELSSLSVDKVNKPLLNQIILDMAVAKSNIDSISIELTESQQMVTRLEKETRESENRLNVVNIFGFNTTHMGAVDIDQLQNKFNYQKKLLELEEERVSYLGQLQVVADKTLQLYKVKFTRVQTLLKSQAIMQMSEQQAKAELGFQQQQAQWLHQLNELNNRLSELQLSKTANKALYEKLEADIFYVNENVNFSYLQMLTARYKDQIQQIKISINRGGPITLLSAISDQVQVLTKQLARVNNLLQKRVNILDKRKQLYITFKSNNINYMDKLQKLGAQYQEELSGLEKLDQKLLVVRTVLARALQQELLLRQGLPGLDSRAWLDLGAGVLLLPTLAYHVIKNLTTDLVQTLGTFSYSWWALLAGLEVLWVFIFYCLHRFSIKAVSRLANYEFGHVNLKWLSITLLDRNLIDLAFLGNILWLLWFCDIPTQSLLLILSLSGVWLFFKAIITLARLYLVETAHDRAGIDVNLFYRLKWTFIIGGVITALAVFVCDLPVGYEVKDLFIRLFLSFILIISLVLLRSWTVLPSLIVPHIDERRTYLKRVVWLLGLLVPLVLIINAAIGLIGFVNLIYIIFWYECVFLLILVSYLILRGLLIEGMELLSHLLIRHVANGWLWTEAFLKPIDRVVRIAIFLTAWAVLFLSYGWDRQSPIVERLNKLIHYPLATLLKTIVTPLSIIELVVIISLLYWAAKWTREFAYRLLLSRTQDSGMRNSIAILSQYTMIIVGIFIGLAVLGVDFAALTVAATVFLATLAWGLRDVVNNFASGFLLLFERPLKIGDVVTINGHEGDVIHTGGRAVTIRTWDHIDVVVPNSEIFSKTFMNWTSKDNIVRTITHIKIDRNDNPTTLQELIHSVLTDNKNVLKDPEPEVYLKEWTEGLMEFEIRYYVNLRLIKSRFEIKSQVLVSIWEMFEKQGIKPSYPHREIHINNSLNQ
jgi:potassium efflux system protein